MAGRAPRAASPSASDSRGCPKFAVGALAHNPNTADQDSGEGPHWARYAQGKDYHNILRKRLARLGKTLVAATGDHHSCRATVDSAPVNERQLATMAGLGWLGKNSLLLHPKRGSFHHIGGLFTTIRLPVISPQAGADRCGSCTRCETRCPTGALVERRVLSTRCISYLTIEHHGVIPRELAARFEGWWFGCDLCQVVCPWNRFAPDSEDARLEGSGESLNTLLTITEDTFDEHFAGRAVRRIGWERFRRNLLVALWSLTRNDEAVAIVKATPLPLVIQQADELGLGLPLRDNVGVGKALWRLVKHCGDLIVTGSIHLECTSPRCNESIG